MTFFNKRRAYFMFIAALLIAFVLSGQAYSNPMVVNPQKAARIDVCFLLDSTGSMSDEITVVKQKIWEIVNEILLGEPRPDVRFSIVTYRDRGDEYVVKKFHFTRDIDRLHSDLMQIVATGGGDKREDVNEAFRTAVHNLRWDMSKGVARMIFLIGDAGPQYYSQSVRYQDTAKVASKKNIQVFSIGCSGIDHNEIFEFKQISSLTGGVFEFLTYKMDVEQDGMKKTLMITGDDASIAEPGALDEREWRRGAEELKSAGKARKAKEHERIVIIDKYSGEKREVDADEMGGSYNTQSMENNLDTVIRRQIQVQAEMQGAYYANPELKVKITETKKVKSDDPWYVELWQSLIEIFTK